MLTLGPSLTLEASATDADVVTVTVSYALTSAPVTPSSSTTYETAQGQLASSPAALVTTASGQSALVSGIEMANTNGAGSETVSVYVGGTTAANLVKSLTIPAGGSATYGDTSGWTVFDSAGLPLTSSGPGSGLRIVYTHSDYTASTGDYVVADASEGTTADVEITGTPQSSIDPVNGTPADLTVTASPTDVVVVVLSAVDPSGISADLTLDDTEMSEGYNLGDGTYAITVGFGTPVTGGTHTVVANDTSGTATASAALAFALTDTNLAGPENQVAGSGQVTSVDCGTDFNDQLAACALIAYVLCPTGTVEISDSSDLEWTQIGEPLVLSSTVAMQNFIAQIPANFNPDDFVVTISQAALIFIGQWEGTPTFSTITLPPDASASVAVQINASRSSDVVNVVATGDDTFQEGSSNFSPIVSPTYYQFNRDQADVGSGVWRGFYANTIDSWSN